mgnify:CR=1 FL=1
MSESNETSSFFTERDWFIGIAAGLLLLSTARLSGDMYAFAWSLVVLAGAMYYA